jgi:hypothetical protein
MKWLAHYAHPFIFFVDHPAADTSADVFHAEGELAASPFDEVALTFDLARFTSNLSTLGAARETRIAAQRGTDSTVVTVGFAEEWMHQLSPSWAWTQSGSAGVAIPVGGGSSLFTSSATTGPRLALEDHAFSLAPNVTYSTPLAQSGDQDLLLSGHQVLVGGLLGWQWAFAPPDWALALRGGVTAALAGASTEVQPVGGAALRFQRDGYGMTLSYDRAYSANILTGQTLFSDSVALRGEIPIVPDADIRASTGSGFALSRAIDVPRAVDAQNVKTVIADAAVGWYPSLYPHLEARYQYTRQWDAPADQIVLPNFERNVFSVSVRYMWPPVALTLPKGHRQDPLEEGDALEPIR